MVKKKHITSRRCATIKCRRSAEDKRTVCRQCRLKKRKEKDIERYVYVNLKANSKRRGKEFTITLDEFRKFCRKTKYIAGRGRSSESLTIDRKDETKGYVKGNLRTLTNTKNIKKYLKYSKDATGKPCDFKVEAHEPLNPNDYPF